MNTFLGRIKLLLENILIKISVFSILVYLGLIRIFQEFHPKTIKGLLYGIVIGLMIFTVLIIIAVSEDILKVR